MTIDEMKQQKTTLAHDIVALVREFEEKSDVTVETIRVLRFGATNLESDKRPSCVREIEIKVNLEW